MQQIIDNKKPISTHQRNIQQRERNCIASGGVVNGKLIIRSHSKKHWLDLFYEGLNSCNIKFIAFKNTAETK